jgi:hypothetical protein
LAKHDSSLQRKRFHCSRVKKPVRFTPLQPTLGIAHGDLRLVCGCSAMESYFMKFLLAEAVWNSVVSVATEDRQIYTHYAFRHSVVPFCDTFVYIVYFYLPVNCSLRDAVV